MKFLDKETGTLGERIRTFFKEQGITIVSILTALGMTLGVLIEALLGGSSTSTTTSESTTTSDKKSGAREWIKNNLNGSDNVNSSSGQILSQEYVISSEDHSKLCCNY